MCLRGFTRLGTSNDQSRQSVLLKVRGFRPDENTLKLQTREVPQTAPARLGHLDEAAPDDSCGETASG